MFLVHMFSKEDQIACTRPSDQCNFESRSKTPSHMLCMIALDTRLLHVPTQM